MAKIYNPNKLIENLENFSIFPFQNYVPTLAIIIKENAPESEKLYLKSLQEKAEKYKAKTIVYICRNVYDATSTIQNLRKNFNINGIIILSSFGEDVDRALKNLIPSRLDIDCVSSSSFGELVTSNSQISYRYAPCTAGACYRIINDVFGSNDFSGKSIGIVNRSLRVGRPLAEILTQHNATVTDYHSKSGTMNLKQHDAVICAIGSPKFFTAKDFRDGQLIIDVGINVDENGKICGDVDFENVLEALGENGVITPVPGCCGKLTTTILFAKLFYGMAESMGEISHG